MSCRSLPISWIKPRSRMRELVGSQGKWSQRLLKLALKDPENGYEMDMNHYEINFWCLWFCYRISIQFKNAHTAKPALCGCASVVKVSKYLVEVARILMWANFKKIKTELIAEYGYIKQHHWRERFIVGILCLPLCLLNKAHIQGTETLSC